MPIHEVGRSGERKKPEREEKEEEEGSGKKVEAGLKHHLGAPELLAPNCLPCHRHVCFEPKISASGTLAPRRVSSAPATMALR